jgi:hypothetical protein
MLRGFRDVGIVFKREMRHVIAGMCIDVTPAAPLCIVRAAQRRTDPPLALGSAVFVSSVARGGCFKCSARFACVDASLPV